MTRYVLTGTTGRLGSRILASLLEAGKIPPADLIVSSSSPARLAGLAKYGVEVRYGDYAEPASLRSAFAGADVLFLMSHPDPGVGRVALHRNAVEAARAAGVGMVIYSSMMLGGETGMDSSIGIQQGHIHTMRYLAQSGMPHIIVRQGIYAEAWGHYVGFQAPVDAASPTTLHWAIPEDFGIAWTSIDELGEGNAGILADHGRYIGQTLRLTGPRSTTVSEIVRLVEQRTGRPVDLRFLGEEASFGWYRGLAAGEGEVVDPLLGRLLRCEPRGIAEMADELFAPLVPRSSPIPERQER